MRPMPSILAALLLAAACAPASAQGVFDMGGLTQSLTIPTEEPPPRERSEPRGEGRRAALPPSSAWSSPPAGPNRAAFDFRPDPAVTTRVRERFLERFDRPETRAKMARNMDNVAETIARRLRVSGLEPTNLSDAQAYLLVSSWQALHRDYRDDASASLRAVSEQMAEINTNKALTDLDDATKQEMAETLLYDAHYILDMSRIAQDSSAVRDYVDAMAKEAGRAVVGFDVAQYRLTEAGFQP